MIVVKVEIWPKGDKTKARVVGEAEIANVSKHDPAPDVADEYEIRAKEASFGDQPDVDFFASFAHMRGEGALVMLASALYAIGKRPNMAPPPPVEGGK